MKKFGWLIGMGIVLIILLALGAWLLLPAWGRGFGFGFMRPGAFVRFPFLFVPGIGMLLFWLLIILGLVAILRSAAPSASAAGSRMVPNETPLDILKRRYAKGEITKEQYEEMKNTLGT